jgi:hypothetical protein
MIPNLLSDLFHGNPFVYNPWSVDLQTLIYNILNWDIVKGGLAFTLGLGIALYAVLKIRGAFGGG